MAALASGINDVVGAVSCDAAADAAHVSLKDDLAFNELLSFRTGPRKGKQDGVPLVAPNMRLGPIDNNFARGKNLAGII